jgi:hypothetical protein
MTDLPIHLPPSQDPHSEPSIHVEVWLPQSNLDGLHALLQWLDGYESAKSGKIPGHFELISHFRQLKSSIYALKDKDK